MHLKKIYINNYKKKPWTYIHVNSTRYKNGELALFLFINSLCTDMLNTDQYLIHKHWTDNAIEIIILFRGLETMFLSKNIWLECGGGGVNT